MSLGKELSRLYPADHKVGMEVPPGGSSCAKCEYVRGQKCRNQGFIDWDGKDKPAGSDKIPKPVARYCCDFFEEKD